MTPFEFNVRKAVEAASRFVELAGGRIGLVRLMKLLYLAERLSLQRFLYPLFGDRYVSMKHGPVPSRAYDLAKTERQGRPGHIQLWQRHFGLESSHEIILRESAKPAALSPEDLEIVESVHDEWRAWDTWDMVEHLHAMLPEWKDPNGSSAPIELATLCRALGFSDEDLESVEEHAVLSRRLSRSP
jgi:uncharacterized phage-associated protein